MDDQFLELKKEGTHLDKTDLFLVLVICQCLMNMNTTKVVFLIFQYI